MFFQQFINAIEVGAMYSLIAIGFSLFFGAINIINFAHGAICMLGAFIGLIIFKVGFHLQISAYVLFPLVLFGSIVFCGLVGMMIERIAFRPLRKTEPLATLVTSLAIYIIIEQLVMNLFPDGASPHPFPDPFNLKAVTIGSVRISYLQILLVIVSLLIVLLVHILVSKSKTGRAIRATSEDIEAAEMMGVDTKRIISLTFFIGSALGATAGLMNGMNYSLIKFDMGFSIGLKGFTAAILGGLGNIYGAIIGGYALALLEVMASAYIANGSAYKDVIAFVMLIAILILKPTGILPSKKNWIGPLSGRG